MRAKHAFGKGAAILVTALIVGAAVLGFAAGGWARSQAFRSIDLRFGDHLNGDAIKISCFYSRGTPPVLGCFGPSSGKSVDPELGVEWTREAVKVRRCWNDCASPKSRLLFTARR